MDAILWKWHQHASLKFWTFAATSRDAVPRQPISVDVRILVGSLAEKMEDKLIVAVTAHPELYDTYCGLYRDRYKKEQAWIKVSEVAGLPGKFC